MKKQKTCVIVDSSSCIKDNQIENVYSVPLSIIETSNGNETVYKDLIDINTTEVVKKILEDKNLKTSQSTLGEMIEILEKLTASYDRIFVISISSGISGSYNTWNMAREEFADKDIIVLDAKDLGYGNEIVVKEIFKLVEQNKTNQEIIDYVEDRKKRRYAALVVTDISQLKKGGRIGAAKAWIVDKLKLNIIITFDGSLDFFDKSKDFNKTIDKCIEKIGSETGFKTKGIKNACIYTTFLENNKNFEIKSIVDEKIGFKTELKEMPSAIAVHTGAKAFAIYIEAN